LGWRRIWGPDGAASITFGLRVMCPTTGSSVPEINPSSVDLPMPASIMSKHKHKH